MAPLFSKGDLNKLWHDVQNEVTLICTKFGKDLFNISKVIGRKTKWPRFLAYHVDLMLRILSHVTGIFTQLFFWGGAIDVHPTQTFGERVPLTLMDWCPRV